MSELRDAAVAYAERGWRVFRIRPGEKVPMDKWVNGGPGQEASNNWFDIGQRWGSGRTPNANIGIATGNGLAVLDIDVHHGGARPSWAPETLTARTPNGGFHLYYRVTRPVRNSAGLLGPGVDVRGDGGMVVAPPSVLYVDDPSASDSIYEWINDGDHHPGVATIDASLLDPPRTQKRGKKLAAKTFGEGERHDAMLTLAGKMRSIGCEFPEIYAALHALNASRFQPPLEHQYYEKVAKSIMQYDADSDLLS